MAVCWVYFRETSIMKYKCAEEDLRYIVMCFIKSVIRRGGPDAYLTNSMENGASEFPIS